MSQVEFTEQTQEVYMDAVMAEMPCLTEYQRASLALFEEEFMNDQNDHPWWPFFDTALQDETGALWSVYNRWFDETRPDGWKIAYCSPKEEFFAEIDVNHVIRSAMRPVRDGSDNLTTFQLHIRDDALGMQNNDVLNLLLYHNQDGISRAALQMWNQAHAMEPITGYSRRIN